MMASPEETGLEAWVLAHGLAQRVADLEERVDLLETPFWRRLLFYANGWPRLPVPATAQKWRPWHRWGGRRDR